MRLPAIPSNGSAWVLAILCLALALPSPLGAQEDEEAAVREVVERLFEGMRAGDSTAVRSVFHPEARLMTTGVRDGQPRLQEGSLDDFVRAVGTPHDEVWDEHVDDVEVRVDDPLATAWMTYRFHLGDAFSHCGVNSFQLVRTEAGWRILHLLDTRRTSCPE